MDNQLDLGIPTDSPIIPAPTAIETFRDSGYRSTAAALAELIDNSIEAEAKNIQILTFEEPVQNKQRTLYQIKTIAVYDDGCGMSPQTLFLSLQFAVGTRMSSRKGIGRFGIGLPNASISQCCRVEVYSWVQKNQCFKTYLDIEEIKANNQQNSKVPTECEFPEDILNEIEGEIGDSGTIVVWSKCDRLDAQRSKTLYNRMEKDLCRIYRHFLDDDDSYGGKVNISLKITGRDKEILTFKANDPLYILTPNNLPDRKYQGIKTNLLEDDDPITIPIPYGNKGEVSVVEMRFSVAEPETQALGGNSDVGQHYGKNTGISFVRACREVDFGDFGFFNTHDPRNRWWGCEIRFEPVLDELFGVINNKQSLRDFRYIDPKSLKKEYGEEMEWDDDDKRLQLMKEISKIFYQWHSQVMKTITQRNAGKKGSKQLEKEKSVKVANESLETSTQETKSDIEGAKKSDEQIDQELLADLEDKNPALSSEEKKRLIIERRENKIDFDFASWPGPKFFEIKMPGRGRTTVIVFNTQHPFYTEIFEPLYNKDNDPRISNALELMMMAYARVEDELYSYEEELDEISSRWGWHLSDFLKRLKKEA